MRFEVRVGAVNSGIPAEYLFTTWGIYNDGSEKAFKGLKDRAPTDRWVAEQTGLYV